MNDGNGKIYALMTYDDAGAAVEWLGEAFGFTEVFSAKDEQGRVIHAELRYGDSVVMLGRVEGSAPGDDCHVYVAVPDADALFQRAVAAGARVVRELTDQDYGSRDFAVRDPEGNVWSFGTYGA